MTNNSSESGTSPEDLPNVPENEKGADTQAATAETGIAIRYWLELIPYPAGSARSLWLFVNDEWRHLDDPDLGTQISVQNAFCKCPERLEVQVWYSGDKIQGLLVKTK
ncbi:hypothetical protein EQO05_02190 [Methanosarcina sp. MSH10X1]|uniref:hypothetical protein n=1 Tax=Methanosarcina sp. MSH10X1 TaxID=2507075 RepID=UPI000FFB1C6D|nr:hypothetical protein [Methanosarcina sp. MSH10X1]RXA21263.1 hypothetical protein EQO05_02190 [Methanosarcina sp. MSH10X1]